MTKAKLLILLLLLIPSLCSVASPVPETLFNQRVVWKYGKDGQPWETAFKKPNGQASYQLILQPLWAVEGGIVALEIVVARQERPDVNLLGERENGIASPFVITVGELERGLAHSKFG